MKKQEEIGSENIDSQNYPMYNKDKLREEVSLIRKVGRPRRLTVEQELCIYKERTEGFKRIEELAIAYDVSSSTITRIIRKFKEVK